MRTPAAVCLVLAAASCGGERRAVVIDLARELATAEVIQETPVIDAGTPMARRWLANGWYPDEGGAGTDFAWSEGDASTVEIVLLEPRPVEVQLRCRPFQTAVVEVEVNGQRLATLDLESGFGSYPLRLPAESLRAGRNRLVFRYQQARSPRELGLGNDWRRLALALDRLRLGRGEAPPPPSATDVPAVQIPAGTSVGYHLRFTDGLGLELDGVDPLGAPGCRLRCRLTRDGGAPLTVAELEATHGPARIELVGPSGEPLRLELQAVDPAHGSGAGTGVTVLWPRLTAPAPAAAASRRSTAAARGGERQPPSIVIYLVDALRADRLGVYGQPRPLSPNVDTFAAGATVYDSAWAQSSWTRPAVASVLTGLRPEVHGAVGRLDRLGSGMPTLAERLAEAGYATAAVVANPNASADFGLDRGFAEFALMPAERRRSSDVHEETVRWLDRRDPSQPFLLYVHTVDPHLPYDPPEEQRRRFAPGVERPDLGATEVVGALLARDLEDEGRWAADLLALYDAEVASNDQAFGALLDELDRRGLGDGAVIVFVSDHGEEFYDHGGWIHGRTLYREVLQVPLIIRYPGQRDGRREAAAVSHVDLMPTLLELAGLDAGPDLHGRSLLAPLDPNRSVGAHLDLDGWGGSSAASSSRHALRHSRLGYTGPAELYDVRADPAEQRDLGGELGVSAGTMLDESKREILDDLGRHAAEEAVIDDELRRRLEALGYL